MFFYIQELYIVSLRPNRRKRKFQSFHQAGHFIFYSNFAALDGSNSVEVSSRRRGVCSLKFEEK